MKETVIKDSKQKLSWQSYILIGLGVLIGIVIVSLMKHGEINWISIGRATGVGALLFFSCFLLLKGTSSVLQKGN